ncbi:ATP-binding protein [Thermodesulfobacterium sp. TA1]|uniref:P-loop NTPase n=1 Tax=Thermodesulfobacterium sp. TA1 TaxID=2234087 RepID=UPI001232B55B|nr:P-loop NTPase [Thermodesulfobacterium sp. TA1]QER41273.1 ATP-binding protein [Thermodesulfobacterium sp. TA1]
MEEKGCPTKGAQSLKEELKKHTGLRDVRFVLAVGSGKGGVGKTTASTLLALGLRANGYSVGLFDLDFYGPNVNLALGLKDKSPLVEFGRIKPVLGPLNLKVMSLALMVSEKEPVFMRGLMASKLLQELVGKVEWGPLDFLVLDLPPGTGDIFLTMLDLFSPEGFVLVTTANKMALADALRTMGILKEKEVPVLGVIKNFAGIFDQEEAFQAFLEKTKPPFVFEIPFIKELSSFEDVSKLFQLPEKRDFLQGLVDQVLERALFRIR